MKIRTIFCGILAMMVLMAMPMAAQTSFSGKYKKALVIGAHPDDPETICGGTMLVLKNQGCEVVSVYLTSGEAGINGKTDK